MTQSGAGQGKAKDPIAGLGEGVARLEGRVDEIGRRLEERGRWMDEDFARLDADIKMQAKETRSGFARLERTMTQAAIALSSSMVIGFGTLIGLIATQL